MRLPDDTQRLSIVGRTGSGKTVAAIWHLSNANFHEMPWVVYDFKRDKSLARIGDFAQQDLPVAYIGTDTVPREPGIYFVQPHPDETEAVQTQMWRIWEQENIGVYADEGYLVCGPANQNSAFRSLLTQGRSKHIPMIILSQRPVWLDRFVFSESDFYQVFHLNHVGDRKKMMEYIPANISASLPPYHSYYHDVSEGETFVMKPVPEMEVILSTFEKRLEAMKPSKKRWKVI
jgi:hypothetical protein